MTDQSSTDSPANLWIVGSSGAALQIWAVVKALGARQYVHRGFIVKDQPHFDVEELDVRGEEEFIAHANPDNSLVVIGVGNPSAREALAMKFARAGFSSPSLVHPSAIVGPQVFLGEGCVVMANAILETHIRLGVHVLVNLGATVAHEGIIGSFTNIGPHACLAGNTIVGERCDLGAGVISRPRIRLGSDIVAGAGAVIVRDYPDPTTIVGVPAKPIRFPS